MRGPLGVGSGGEVGTLAPRAIDVVRVTSPMRNLAWGR